MLWSGQCPLTGSRPHHGLQCECEPCRECPGLTFTGTSGGWSKLVLLGLSRSSCGDGLGGVRWRVGACRLSTSTCGKGLGWWRGGAARLSTSTCGEGLGWWREGAARLSTSTTDMGRDVNCSGSAFGGLTWTSSLRTLSEVMSRMVCNVKFLGSSPYESSLLRMLLTSASMYRLTRPSNTSTGWLTCDTAEDFLPMVLMLSKLLSSY